MRTFKNSLLLKFSVIFLIAVIVPIILSSATSVKILGDKLTDGAIENRREISEQVAYNLSGFLNDRQDLILRLSYNRILMDALNPDKNYTAASSMDVYRTSLNPLTQFMTELTGEINSARSELMIYYTNSTLLQDYTTYVYLNDEMLGSEEIMDSIAANGRITQRFTGSSLNLSKAVFNIYTKKLVCVIRMEIPIRKLQEQIAKYHESLSIIMIINESGRVIASNASDNEGIEMTEALLRDIRAHEIFDYGGKEDYTVITSDITSESGDINWQIATFIPMSHFAAERKATVTVVLLGLCVFVPLSVFLCYLMLRKILSRINSLTDKMILAKSGVFRNVATSGTNDEIDRMTDSYNTMINSIETLIYENYESEIKLKDIAIKKKEAEINALQSQINPHFIFNTLESLRMNLLAGENAETSEAVVKFSRMMRRSLDYTRNLITLEEEMSFIRDYLEIQAFRFGDRVSYGISLQEASGKCYIPKFTIQPIVENAIIHGIEDKIGGGKVFVSSCVEGDKLFVSVVDNGVGIEPAKLLEISDALELNEAIEGHLGLKNPNERIKLHYGGEYGITVASGGKGTGTTVTIIYPARLTDK